MFNLEKSIFLSPLLLCGTAALAKHREEKGKGICHFLNPLDASVRDYLSAVGYPYGVWNTENTFEARRKLVTLQSRNFVPLVGFAISESEDLTREQLIQSLEDLLDKQCHLTGARLTALRYLVSELTGNIGYHGVCGSGFVIAQYRPSLHCIDMAIADTGVGLRQGYLNNGFVAETDAQALTKALEGVSTKKNQQVSRGFGLHTSRNMLVKGMKGDFFLWSGNACLFNTPRRENLFEIQDGTSFPGCYLALRIPTMYDSAFRWEKYAER
ncbi:MAG: hypothetical protein WAU08_02555 [Flavobacteriales bacterium]